MGWIIYAVVVLVASGIIGMHLGRFREVYTEMLGMMVGMTMGMLNGFLLGYTAAALTNSMFWGNLAGILLGLALGVYFGRPGGLMGVMDGGMGGVMGGSMGAMLSVMVAYPRDAQVWTGILLGGLYVMGMVSLVVLIERSAPGHAAFHRLTPFLARAISIEIAEAADETEAHEASSGYVLSNGRPNQVSSGQGSQGKQRRLVNYYALLGVPQSASEDDIAEAYLEKIDTVDDASRDRLERALAVLTDSQRRESYDRKLVESQIVGAPLSDGNNGSSERGDCCPPPRQKKGETNSGTPVIAASLPSTRAGDQAAIKVAPQPFHASGAVTSGGPGKASQGTRGFQNGSGGRPGVSAGTPRANGSQNGAAPALSPATKQGGSARGSKQNKGNGQRQEGGRAAQKQQARYSQAPQEQRSSPVSWVGGLAAVVIIVALGWWVMTAAVGASGRGSGGSSGSAGIQSGASGQTLAQLDAQAVVAPVGADGKQTMDVVLDSATFQYKPSTIKVKQGVPVHFNLSVINGDPG